MKARRDSYQQGTIQRIKRKRGADVWVIRYRRYHLDGTSEQVAEKFSDAIECPTKALALKKAEEVRRRINEQRACVYFRDLAQKYRDEIIVNERPHLQATKKANLRYIEERWGDERIDEIAKVPLNIETWLNSLKSFRDPEQDLSKQTRQHVRNLFHHIFKCAKNWGLVALSSNPVSTVSVKKGKNPKARDLIVTPELFQALLDDEELPKHIKVMIQVAMFTGLRASEFLGLKWEDVDFDKLVINVRRSVVGNHIDETKTLESAEEVHIGEHLAAVLDDWKKDKEYLIINGWVFGSVRTEQPFHESTMQGKYLRPAGERAGVKGLGWHSFRHTYRANLRDFGGATLETQSQMMRHTTLEMTTKYGRKSEEKKQAMRQAHEAVVAKVTGAEVEAPQDETETLRQQVANLTALVQQLTKCLEPGTEKLPVKRARTRGNVG